MKEIIVSAEHTYSVKFSDSFLRTAEELVNDRRVTALVPTVLSATLKNLPAHWKVIEVPNGEAQKSLTTYANVLEQLASFGFPRTGVIIGIGGGATTDLAGFVAATYLRGIDWLAVPTSLAAMVDASIGGKTGLNLTAGKNLVGSFYSPQAVIIDVSFLNSLSERDKVAGLAEVVKCGFISDPKILDLLQESVTDNLAELIFRAVQVKAGVVSQDFKESFHREILNYGHTLGHAIEKHSNYHLRHGECVAIGMVFAAELSHRYSGLSRQAADSHQEVLMKLGLPTSYPADTWPELFALMQNDKKKSDLGLRFVTLADIGSPVRAEGLSEAVLQDVYLSVIAQKGKS